MKEWVIPASNGNDKSSIQLTPALVLNRSTCFLLAPIFTSPEEHLQRTFCSRPRIHRAFVCISSLSANGNMCVWLSKETFTACGCTVVHTSTKPTCKCAVVIEQGVQKWDGPCKRSQCPNPKK